ncbi:histidine kinase/DNA gyrase B/HSP90-like ATPase [Kribbella antiqua]|uniref:histidine kinase n=1 Tax=Kribbella antiqua TaxID=2512217 RepID=A0A4R2IKD5_9ACTN|nr:sensor histidine kinase [Kribbella antiqua]TCO45077.1 histidine kinase/DNA gyrase B/HSP90-like ATPase [Kribbella antiqua]
MGVVVGGLAVLMGLVGAGLHAVNAAAGRTSEPSFWLMELAASVAYGLACLLLRATDANWIRLLLGLIGLTQGLALFSAELGLLTADSWATWLGSWLWAPGYAAIAALLPLLLPDGRPATRRWRPVLWLTCAAVVVTALTWALTPYESQDFPEALRGETNPVGVAAVAQPVIGNAAGVLLVAAVLAGFASLVMRWRRVVDVERQQLKWVLVGYACTVVLFGFARLLPGGAAGVVAALAMLPLPLAIGFAVMRYGLWDVDVVISRVLVYAGLSALVIALYAVTVWLVGDRLGATTGAPILATTAVALVALPLRSWLQRHVNRLVHGDVDEPYAVLARLGDRLAAATTPDDLSERVLPSVVEQVARSLRAQQATIQLRDGLVTSYGDGPVGRSLTVELEYAGERFGRLTVARSAEFDDHEVRALDQLAAQAAVAAHTVLLARESQRSREAVVVAREEERRRLRRDLHDGVGPSLAALALHVETARDIAPDDPDAARRLLDRLVPRLNAAVADVRAMVHELRPPMLDELGLAAAVRELGDRLSTGTTTVRVLADEVAGLPAAVEVAAYHIAGEATGNAVRHAGASSVAVRVQELDGCLRVEVVDDGSGLPDRLTPGVGTSSMRERAEELGGQLTIDSGPDGTRVIAVLPRGAL